MRCLVPACLALAIAGCGPEDPQPNLYVRLGEEPGIRTIITTFVGRVVGDPKINGFFLNKQVNAQRLVDCLVAQVGNATGGPQVYPDARKGCRSMKDAHVGLGISTLDFNDLVAHLVASLEGANVGSDDIATITGVLAPLAPDIVEDTSSNRTVYQRLGRRPGIAAAIDAFIDVVAHDNRINGFFAAAASNPDRLGRLKTCLVRQVASVDGPIRYGFEVTSGAEPGVSGDTPCHDMLTSHQNLTSGGAFISIEDFNALVEDLVTVLDTAHVPTADKQAVLGALAPLCTQIVKNGAGC